MTKFCQSDISKVKFARLRYHFIVFYHPGIYVVQGEVQLYGPLRFEIMKPDAADPNFTKKMKNKVASAFNAV